MSRPLRIEFPGAWYHVMNRGRRGEKIFTDRADFQNFVDLLKDGAELWQVKISSFCLMPNHYHMLVTTPLGNLSRFMRHLDGVYTQTFNRKHKYDGPLFKGRFKSILVDGDSYLLQLVRYIHRNPLRAGLVKSLDDYLWSSHMGYLSRSKDWNWLHKDFVLSMLSQVRRQQLNKYRQFVLQEDSKEVLDLLDKSRWPAFWGSEDFGSWVKEEFYAPKTHKEVPDSTELAPRVEAILEAVCQDYGIQVEGLKIVRRGQSNEARGVAMYLIRVLRRDTLVSIGKEFSLTRYSSVSSVLQKVKARLKEEKSFRNRVEGIRTKILKG